LQVQLYHTCQCSSSVSGTTKSFRKKIDFPHEWQL